MGKTARLEPDYDILDDEFGADSEMDLEFDEENLDHYLETQDARSNRAHLRVSEIEESERYRLPRDWQDFDYSEDDWD